jgi:hypothetical protein
MWSLSTAAAIVTVIFRGAGARAAGGKACTWVVLAIETCSAHQDYSSARPLSMAQPAALPVPPRCACPSCAAGPITRRHHRSEQPFFRHLLSCIQQHTADATHTRHGGRAAGAPLQVEALSLPLLPHPVRESLQALRNPPTTPIPSCYPVEEKGRAARR